jgi:hypothetical protein
VEAILHAFLTSVLDGKKCLLSQPGRFSSKEKVPDIQWVVSSDILDGKGKRKISTAMGKTRLSFR